MCLEQVPWISINLHDGTKLDRPPKLKMEHMVSSIEELEIQWSCVLLIMMNIPELNKAYMIDLHENKYQTQSLFL